MLTKLFPDIATSGRHNFAMITDRQKFTTKLTLYGILVSILPLESIHGLSLGSTVRTGNISTQILVTSAVLYCVLKPIVCRSAGADIWKTDICKKSRLNWKLKISNAADNADITQSQARDTRHRRMQKVNRWCTNSGPLRSNTVLCHSTRYSLLVAVVVVCVTPDACYATEQQFHQQSEDGGCHRPVCRRDRTPRCETSYQCHDRQTTRMMTGSTSSDNKHSDPGQL